RIARRLVAVCRSVSAIRCGRPSRAPGRPPGSRRGRLPLAAQALDGRNCVLDLAREIGDARAHGLETGQQRRRIVLGRQRLLRPAGDGRAVGNSGVRANALVEVDGPFGRPDAQLFLEGERAALVLTEGAGTIAGQMSEPHEPLVRTLARAVVAQDAVAVR